MHDPTTLNRQGQDDIGTQYRSAIFYLTETQRLQANNAIFNAQSKWADPIVTEVTVASTWWRAEDYH